MVNTANTVRWDAAVYLDTDEDIVEFLAAAFETGDAEDVTHALATIARARGMSEIAKAAGLARGSLYKAIGEGANPTLATLLSVMNALNVSLSVKPKVAA
ncbi:MAG: addiction module antidote protein [Caulobacteraceae bacterium]